MFGCGHQHKHNISATNDIIYEHKYSQGHKLNSIPYHAFHKRDLGSEMFFGGNLDFVKSFSLITVIIIDNQAQRQFLNHFFTELMHSKLGYIGIIVACRN